MVFKKYKDIVRHGKNGTYITIEEELDSLLKMLKSKIGKRFPLVVKEVLAEQNKV